MNSAGQSSMFIQADKGLTPASGYYMQRDVQVSQTSSNWNTVKIPNSLKDSGQARSDGTYSPYTNIGSSNDADAVAFLSFDISSIPKDATIRSASLEFKGWDMVGTPFSRLGCLNIFPASYRLLGSQSYSSIISVTPYGKICSSGDLGSPLSFPDLIRALQASLNQGKFQLRLQFDRSALSPVSGEVMLARGSPASEDESSDEVFLRTYISPISSGYGSYSGSPVSSSSSQQMMQDMGLDPSFIESDLSGDNKISNYGYILLDPGVNLSKLGITPEMIEKAIDPGQVSVSANYMYEKASVNVSSDGSCAYLIYDETGMGGQSSRGVPMCYDCNNNKICDYREQSEPDGNAVSSSGCPAGYCPDEDNDGVCDPEANLNSNVIGVSHIGWLSRDPAAGSEIKGRHVEVQSPAAPNCCPDFDSDGKCDNAQVQLQSVASADLLKVGVVWLAVEYGFPSKCDQNACQAQSKSISEAYVRDGKIYQKFSDCGCAENTCRCQSTEKVIGEVCDQKSCETRSRVIDTYSKDDKIYQEVRKCSCVENSCKCDIVEELIGAVPILPPPRITTPGLGNLTFKLPDSKSLIESSEWGEVPPNQVLVEFYENTSKIDLEAFANSLGGRIVGYDDSINLYQIETAGKTEADLKEAISKAERNSQIKYAFPNQEVYFYLPPLDDPVYGGDRKESYDIVGVEQAWNLINDSGLPLSEVCVGVTDDGLYKGFGEFNETDVAVEILDYSELEAPVKKYSYVGSHGTGIMNVIAADPDNGGLVGIASEPLRDNLTVFMCNFSTPDYSQRAKLKGNPYSKALEALRDVINYQASILSISWGTREADPRLIGSFKDAINKWSKYNPKILLICAAPDDVPTGYKREMDGNCTCPSGFNFSNVITVGSIMNNGTVMTSGYSSPNYEITLTAPGEEVVFYKDKSLTYTNRYFGGTSMAVPMVVSAAAMIRSLNDSLTAAEIKDILIETARTNITVGGNSIAIPPQVGGRVLAIDLAVKKVIEDRRNATIVG